MFNSAPQPEKVLTVSENNRELDIARFFERREEMKKDLLEIVGASTLSEEKKNVFNKKIEEFILDIVDHATSPSRYDAPAYDIASYFVRSIVNFSGMKGGEDYEVFVSLRDYVHEKYRKPIAGF